MKIEFTGRVTGALNNKLDEKIVNAIESSPALRKQIAQVFQKANRRIQNVEKTGLFSPAVAGLNKSNVSGYSKFSLKNFPVGVSGSWQALKEEYAKAVAFLNQPTSTAAGTRQYNEAIKKRYNLTDEEFKGLSDNVLGKITSLSESQYIEEYLKRYKDFTGDFEASARDSAAQMESDARKIEDSLQRQIDDEAKSVVEELQSYLDSVTQSILEGFKI